MKNSLFQVGKHLENPFYINRPKPAYTDINSLFSCSNSYSLELLIRVEHYYYTFMFSIVARIS